MEQFEEQEKQRVDVVVLIGDILREARRVAAVGLVLVVLCGILMPFRAYRSYYPSYKATATFTVKVANPLQASVSSYNAKTAEQLAKTFPYILTSGVLQQRIQEHLGISYMPSVNVSASTNSSIITMTVQDSDPQRAYDVLNAVIKYYPEIAEFVVGPTVLVLLDESGVPTEPVSRLDLKNSAADGVLIGAVLWIALATLLALTKTTVHNEEELQKIINTPCLGQVPSVKLPGRKTVCPLIHLNASRSTGFSETFWLLSHRVEKLMEKQDKKILLVSSALPGEGKTTVSVNLAISLASKGKRVLLIDTDLRNPSVARALDLHSPSVLPQYLDGQVSVRELLVPSGVENLFVIAGGDGEQSRVDQLSQERIRRLIQASRSLFDYVILDTPPCSMLADAAEVAELAECGLMVIRQNYASRDQILDGILRLSDSGLPIIGCAFNGVRRSLGRYGYGYGYGYGNGYGKNKRTETE